MFKSQKFVDDIVNTVSSYTDNLLSEAKENASSVTEDDEAVSQYVIEALIQPHDSEDFKASVRDVLKEVGKDGGNEKENDSNDGNDSNE